ncbi:MULTISPECIES: hypothetical protein [Marinobacter]|uniref:Uncharacterized protein n=1 Tax=Marinobacter suaedae TaxID=3057675 RepID=A0ABT8W1L7_9GAMM|nr:MULTISPECIES: hypothetical protein [unclassified Marinobacter]MBZ2168147.1 hypothetical protein [Marinobacter sp. F4216]MDO3722124.1 hypothetical protein [Marinobacter sp. chi1]
MPIANCVVNEDSGGAIPNLVELWAQASGVDSKEMTLNVIRADAQVGRHYSVMATLYLPSAWPEDRVISLQTGLAVALSDGLGQPLEKIHVLTLIVGSGHVVEDGKVQNWDS